MSIRSTRLWLLGLFIVHAAVHLASFQSVYLDSDQLVIADQARWIARGEIHEPFFFGQSYLLPFEAYLAAPLIWLGVWPIAAVKALSALALYLPFVWAAWVLAKERPAAAWAVAALFIGLHPEYTLAAAMPRGFIVGTGLAWAGLWVLLRHPALPALGMVALAALVGFCTGSYMSIALMLPALAWLPGRRPFVLVSLGLLLGFALFKAVGLFYWFHPDHVVHLFPRLGFRLGYLIHNFGVQEIRAAITHLGVLTAVMCLLVVLPRPLQWEWRTVLPWLACVSGVCLAVALMIANNKIVEFNSKSPFFSVYRMMLPLPFLGLLLLGRRQTLATAPAASATPWPARRAALLPALLVLLLSAQLVRLVRVGPEMAELPSTVPPITFEWLRANCEEIGGWWRESGEPYFTYEGRNDALAYGCHAQFGVPVLQTDHERRTWLRERFAQGVPR